MTTATSTAKTSFFAARFKANLKASKNMMIIITVLQLLGLPVLSFVLYLSEKSWKENDYSSIDNFVSYATPIGFISFSIALFLGFGVVMSSFSYLHKISKSDMSLALPLTTRQRFTADYLSGIIVYVIPAIAAAVIALIPLRMTAEIAEYGYNELEMYYPKLLAAYIAAIIMFYTFITFATVICGSARSAAIAAVLLNIAIPCMFFVVGQVCTLNTISGGAVDVDGAEIMLPYICVSSPIGCAVFMSLFTTSEAFANNTLFYGWFIDVLFITAIVLLLTYFLYKNRKAEHVSKPHVYSVFHHIIMGLGLFSLMSVIIYIYSERNYYWDWDESSLDVSEGFLPAVILGAIFYILVELLSQKSFKHFLRIVIRFGCIAILTIGFCEISVLAGGFGIGEYIPSANKIREISFSTCIDGYEINATFKDKKIIKEIVKANKNMMNASNGKYDKDNYQTLSSEEYQQMLAEGAGIDDNSSYDNITYADIIYYKKDGGFMMRNYRVNESFYEDLLPYIITSDEFASCARKELLRYHDFLNIYMTKKYGHFEIGLTNAERTEFGNAYEKDLKNFTTDQFYTSAEVCTINGYTVRECFTNTIEIINSKIGYDVTDPEFNVPELKDIYDLRLYTSAKSVYSKSGSSDYYVKNKYVGTGNELLKNGISIMEFTQYRDEIIDLIKVSTTCCYDNEIGGALVYNGEVFYVPVEYADTVQMIYNDAKDYVQENLYVDNKESASVYDRYGMRKKIGISSGCFGVFADEDGWYRFDEDNKKVYYTSDNEQYNTYYTDSYYDDSYYSDSYYDDYYYD